MAIKKAEITNKEANSNDELEQLKQIIKMQQEHINTLLNSNVQKVEVSNPKDPYDMNRLVTVIHMDDLVKGLYTCIKGDSEYKFNRIGDKFRIRLIELEKIMASYKRFFELGFLIIAEEDINEYFSLNKEGFISIDTFRNIHKLNVDDLGKVYSSICPTHQDMILRHWFIEYENNNVPYMDYGKVSILNHCSGNKFQSLIDDLNQRKFHKKDK